MAFNIPSNIGPTSSSGFSWDRVPESLKKRMFGGEGQPSMFEKSRASMPQMFSNALKPEMQRVLNTMAGKGIVNSSVTGSAMGKAGSDVAQSILGLNMDSMNQENNILSNLTQASGGFSESKDTSAPYQLLLQLLSM